MSKAKDIVKRFSGISVGVMGDLMLDRYVWGSASRISQEAPVPVVLVRKQSFVPGGAANVARNVLTLRGKVELFGIVGDDLDGAALLEVLGKAGADMSGVSVVKDRPTTVKTRVLAGNQQVVRIDQEIAEEVGVGIRAKLRKALAEHLKKGNFKALVLEDYAKGVFGRHFMQAVVDAANDCGVMTTLDPHPNNAFNVKGLALMTPNRKEAFSLAGVRYVSGIGDPLNDKALLNVARIIMRKWAPRYLLITLGAEGLALFGRDGGAPQHIPTRARQVFDVSGAGDTVMGTIVMALLAGADIFTAAKIANAAAGVVVGMVGTAPIEYDALMEALD